MVFDNRLFGEVKPIQLKSFCSNFIANDLVNPDFARVAESFGVAASSDADGLETALNAAFSRNGPALARARGGEMPSPWDVIMMPRVRG